MTETIKTSEHYYTKEFGRYENSENNFVANQELTVTITLNEYRDLVEKDAKYDSKINEYRNEKYKEQREKEELKEENDALKNKIYALQNPEVNTEVE